MKILLLNYEFPPIGGGGGKATYNLAKELTLLGHRVDVLTARMKGQPYREKKDGFTVFRVMSWRKSIHDCGFRGAFTFLFFAVFRFQQLTRKNRYDVIHYFFGLPTGFLSLLPGPHGKIPYLISLRGSDVPGYDRYNKNLQRAHWLLLPLTRKIWKDAKQIVAVTTSLKKKALQTDPLRKITVIPNGVDPVFFKIPRPENKAGNGLKLISVARLIERKGVQDILTALAELSDPEISLLVVGTGNVERQLEKLCKDLFLNGSVTFYGFCLPQKLPELLVENDVFILPSLAEAFGNVFAEAMACGLPIIGSDIGGIPDLVGKKNGILVAPGDVDQIKGAILKIKESNHLRAQMSRANREKMMKQYNWKSIAKRHIEVYQTNADR